jgi:hypothetical protein
VSRAWIAAAAFVVALGGVAADAGAQGPRGGSPFRPRSVEVDLGAILVGGIDFGDASADLIGNQTPPRPSPLFEVATELQSAPGVEARVGFHLTRTFAVEGAFSVAWSSVDTRISDDAEGAPSITASEDLTQYHFEGSAIVHLQALAFGGGGVPFVMAGAGYLRHLHEGRALVQTGTSYHAGGGIKYLFSRRARGLVRGLGFRADARLYFRQGGFDLDDEEPTRTLPAASASFILAF